MRCFPNAKLHRCFSSLVKLGNFLQSSKSIPQKYLLTRSLAKEAPRNFQIFLLPQKYLLTRSLAKEPPKKFSNFFTPSEIFVNSLHTPLEIWNDLYFLLYPLRKFRKRYATHREVFKFFNPLRKLRRPVIHPVRKFKTFLDSLRKSHQQVQTPLQSENFTTP